MNFSSFSLVLFSLGFFPFKNSQFFFHFDAQPLFPFISQSSHFDEHAHCLQNARVANVSLEVAWSTLNLSQHGLSD